MRIHCTKSISIVVILSIPLFFQTIFFSNSFENEYTSSVLASEGTMINVEPLSRGALENTNELILKQHLIWKRIWGTNENDSVIDVFSYGTDVYTINMINTSQMQVSKWNTNGTEIWNSTWKSNYRDYFYKIFIAQTGIYLVGIQMRMGVFVDGLIVKYNLDGNAIWNRTFSYLPDVTCAYDIFVLNSYIYVVGNSGRYVLLLKYDADGNQIWNTTFRRGNDYLMSPANIFGYESNIYVSGTIGFYGILIKFDINGNYIWNNTLDKEGITKISGMLVSDSNIFLTGNSPEKNIDKQLLLKFNQNGKLVWNQTWNQSGNNVDLSIRDSSIYITGNLNNSSHENDIILSKFDTDGKYLWNITWGGPSHEFSTSITISSDNSIYIGGATESYGSVKYDALLLKYQNSPSSPKLFANPGNKTVKLTWISPVDKGVSGTIANYEIYRNSSQYARISTWTEILDSNVSNGFRYKYAVVAIDSNGVEGDFSNEVAVTPASVPYPPVNPTGKTNGNEIILRWELPWDNGGFNITSYRIYKGNNPGREKHIANVSDQLKWTDNNITMGVSYYYRVSAVNAIGASNLSNEIIVTIEAPSNITNVTIMILSFAFSIIIIIVALLVVKRRTNVTIMKKDRNTENDGNSPTIAREVKESSKSPPKQPSQRKKAIERIRKNREDTKK